MARLLRPLRVMFLTAHPLLRHCWPWFTAFRALLADARGDAAVEYIALIGTIALPAIAAFTAAGKAIVHDYTTLQNILSMPLP